MSNTKTQRAFEHAKQVLHSISNRITSSLSFVDSNSVTPDEMMNSIAQMRLETEGYCFDKSKRHCQQHHA